MIPIREKRFDYTEVSNPIYNFFDQFRKKKPNKPAKKYAKEIKRDNPKKS